MLFLVDCDGADEAEKEEAEALEKEDAEAELSAPVELVNNEDQDDIVSLNLLS